jgi:putative DNA primase/helicase
MEIHPDHKILLIEGSNTGLPIHQVRFADASVHLNTALAWLRGGFSPLPPAEDGSKAPLGPNARWKAFQTTPATEKTVRQWYARGRTGNGVCGGPGGLEPFEFDDRAVYEAYKKAAEAFGLGDLVERIEAGYLEDTPGGGVHWMYACDEVRAPAKLAERPDPADPENRRKTLIETKGQGGFIIVAPSNGKVHPSGGAYRLLRGSPETIARITADEREALWQLARTFDEMPAVEVHQPPENAAVPSQDIRPGEAYEAEHSWEDILEPLGWARVYTRGDVAYWRRPGKDKGISATTGHCKGLYVFSTSTSFEPRRSYTKFGAYARLNHGGDYKAAARELARLGYGQARTPTAGFGPMPQAAASRTRTPGETSLDSKLARWPRTDTGNAERLRARYGPVIRHCHPWKKWLYYDGRRWSMDNSAAVEALAKLAARKILAEAATVANDKRRSTLIRWARQTESRARRSSMIALAASEDGIPILPKGLDSDPWLLNVENGTVNLKTGQLQPHRPGDFITSLAPVAYDSRATCPLYDKVLRRVFKGNDALIAFWYRLCGLSLTGVVYEQILPILFGTGSNGKTTLVRTMVNLLGPDLAMIAPPGLLIVKRHEAHPTERAVLFGKRLVIEMETEEGIRLNENLVKHLTGGDPITTRRCGEDFWSFDPTHKLWLCTNHKPEIRGTDHAIWRRPKLVPFTETIPDAEAILDLIDKLRAEYPGILARCVRGGLDWQEHGLGVPDEVKTATVTYRSEQDTLIGFLDEDCLRDSSVRTKASKLYEGYRDRCQRLGETPISLTAFGKSMEERQFTTTRSNGIWYLGIGLRSDGSFSTTVTS